MCAGERLLAARIGSDERRGATRSATHARAEAHLHGVDHVAGCFASGAGQPGFREKTPGKCFRATDGSPHERRIELPQVARLAIGDAGHLVDQVEVQLGVEPLGQFQRAAVPALEHDPLAPAGFEQPFIERREFDELEVQAGDRAVSVQVALDLLGVLAAVRDHPGIEVPCTFERDSSLRRLRSRTRGCNRTRPAIGAGAESERGASRVSRGKRRSWPG